MIPTLHFLFIVNKKSGTTSHLKFEAIVRRVLGETGAAYAIEYTKAPQHATELARQGIVKAFGCIVAVGGDGTANEVAIGVMGSSTPMAIIPTGSGNGLARHLGIPLDREKALRAIFTSEAISIDTFTLNGRLSINVSGIGFDGHVAGMFGLTGRRGLVSYAQIAMREYRRFGTFKATLTMDGEPTIEHEAFIVALANSAQYGNNARVAPQSSVRDGKLNLNAIGKIPLTRLDLVYSLFRGDITRSPWCKAYEITNGTIKLDRPVRYHVDGEPCTEDDTFSVRINPSSCLVMVPRGRHERV